MPAWTHRRHPAPRNGRRPPGRIAVFSQLCTFLVVPHPGRCRQVLRLRVEAGLCAHIVVFVGSSYCILFSLRKRKQKKTFLWPPLAGPLLYDECQNETRPSLYKKGKVNSYILSGVPGTCLPRPSVLGVGCLTCARSIVGARRWVGENDGAKVEKITKITYFGASKPQFRSKILTQAPRAKKLRGLYPLF